MTDWIGAAVVALEIHAEQCGHSVIKDDCPYCDDMHTVIEAKKELGWIK